MCLQVYSVPAPLEALDRRNQKELLVLAQAYLVLLHFALLHFSGVAFSTP